jgi:dimeric dUTPase (all-alpha-NTP-PPase superfamily)
MNIGKLFQMQKVLSDHIIQTHNLRGQDLLPNMILALQVEVGELANDWQGFKHWKVNPTPKPSMLEEYADSLSFILEIGLRLGFRHTYSPFLVQVADPFKMFRRVYHLIARLDEPSSRQHKEYYYGELFSTFLGLGKSLGFTWGQIEQAYLEKNRINHERQDNGY